LSSILRLDDDEDSADAAFLSLLDSRDGLSDERSGLESLSLLTPRLEVVFEVEDSYADDR
jgi:hypothetical protein